MIDTNEEIIGFASSSNDNSQLIANCDDASYTPLIDSTHSAYHGVIRDGIEIPQERHRTIIKISGGKMRGKDPQAAMNTSSSSSSKPGKPLQIHDLAGHKSAFEKLIDFEERKCKLVYLLLCPVYCDDGNDDGNLRSAINLIKDAIGVPLSSTQGVDSRRGQLIITLADSMKTDLPSLKGKNL